MNENYRKERDLRVLSEANGLECFEVRSNPCRRLHVPVVQKKVQKEESLFDVMDKIGAVVTFVASMGMMFLVLRIGYGV